MKNLGSGFGFRVNVKHLYKFVEERPSHAVDPAELKFKGLRGLCKPENFLTPHFAEERSVFVEGDLVLMGQARQQGRMGGSRCGFRTVDCAMYRERVQRELWYPAVALGGL